MASDLRTRLVLAPLMLALVGAVYWLDWHETLGARAGTLSAALLGLLGLAGVFEYVALLRAGGFAVSRRSLPLLSALLFASAFVFAWLAVDRELYPLVLGTLLLLFPIAVRSLGRNDMRVGLEKQGATLLGFIYVAYLSIIHSSFRKKKAKGLGRAYAPTISAGHAASGAEMTTSVTRTRAAGQHTVLVGIIAFLAVSAGIWDYPGGPEAAVAAFNAKLNLRQS